MQTRVSVFETNSSSTHSLSVSGIGSLDDGGWKAMLSDDRTAIEIEFGEFGWGPEVYRDAPTKASYLLTGIASKFLKSDKNTESFILDEEDMRESKHFRVLQNAIAQHTGISEIRFIKFPSEYIPYGSIDHQSNGVWMEAFENDEESVKAFIFNSKSILVIDNDNH